VNTGGGLARIDAQQGRLAGRVQLPTGNHHALALSRDERTAYVTSSSLRADVDPAKVDILAVDLARKRVTAKIPVNHGGISGLEMAPDGRRIYASHFPQAQGVPNIVSVIDPAAGSVTGTVSVQGRSTGLALALDGRRIYVLNESGMLQVVDTASGKAIANTTVGRETTGMAVSPDGRRAYVTDEGEEQLVVVAIG
jgi:DNA-binding beta-propeller fold protein YncE